MDIKQTDLSSKKGLERRLSVLQALMDTYISNNKPATKMLVPIRNLSEHDLIFSEIDGILDSLIRDSCFSSWEKKTKNYIIKGINHKELGKIYQSEKEANERLKLISSESTSDWKPNLKRSSGVLVLPDRSKMTFRGGNFGGLNILFENLGSYIKREMLKVAISEHHQQGKRKSPSDIVIAEWKGELKKNRGKLFVYFDIEHLEPDSYRLIYKDQQ